MPPPISIIDHSTYDILSHFQLFINLRWILPLGLFIIYRHRPRRRFILVNIYSIHIFRSNNSFLTSKFTLDYKSDFFLHLSCTPPQKLFAPFKGGFSIYKLGQQMTGGRKKLWREEGATYFGQIKGLSILTGMGGDDFGDGSWICSSSDRVVMIFSSNY